MKDIICAFDVRNDSPVEGGTAWNHMVTNIAGPIRRIIASKYGVNARLIPIHLLPGHTSEICITPSKPTSIEVSDELKENVKAVKGTEDIVDEDLLINFIHEFVDTTNLGLCSGINEEENGTILISTSIGEIYPQFIVQYISTKEHPNGKVSMEYEYYIPMYTGNLGVALFRIEQINLQYPFFLISQYPLISFKATKYTGNLGHAMATAKMCDITSHNKVGLPHTIYDAIGIMKYLMLNSGIGNTLYDSDERYIVYNINTDVSGVEKYPKKYCAVLDALQEVSMNCSWNMIRKPEYKTEYIEDPDNDSAEQFEEMMKKQDDWYNEAIKELSESETEMGYNIPDLYMEEKSEDQFKVESKPNKKWKLPNPFKKKYLITINTLFIGTCSYPHLTYQ